MFAKISYFLTWICFTILDTFLRICQIGNRKYCPPIRDPILQKSATELAHLIRTKQLSSEEVVRSFINRSTEVNKIINAIVQDRYDIAIQEAISVDELIKSNVKTKEQLEKETPLLGVPITIKESIAVQGMSNEAGQVQSRLNPATEDATVVQMIKKAGAIIILVSNTPEFSLGVETTNYVTGTTRNPYDTRRSPGGSSGGEGALISSGASIIGLGSDLGGSLRIPAFYTGIFAHKPTVNIVNIDGILPKCNDERLPQYCAAGPLTRYAQDLPLVMMSIVKPELKLKLKLQEKVQMSNLKFYYIEEEILNPSTQKSVKNAMNNFLIYLNEQYGIKAQKVNVELLNDSLFISIFILLSLEEFHLPFYNPKTGTFHYGRELIRYLMCKSKHSLSLMIYGVFKKFQTYFKHFSTNALQKNDELKKQLQELLSDNGVLIYPTGPEVAGYHYESYYKFFCKKYVSIFNTVGLPATHCPTGLDLNGLPVGFQIITNQYNDRINFAVAKEIEKAFGGWIPPPSNSNEIDM